MDGFFDEPETPMHDPKITREQIAELREMASNKTEGPGHTFARAWCAALLLLIEDGGKWIT